MNYTDCIRNKPWLKLCHINNITNRLLVRTNNQAFVVYNLIQKSYELHTVEAYRLSGDSYNTNVPQECLNDFLIRDYLANNFAYALDEFISEKEKEQAARDKYNSNYRREHQLAQQLKTIERVLGTKG